MTPLPPRKPPTQRAYQGLVGRFDPGDVQSPAAVPEPSPVVSLKKRSRKKPAVPRVIRVTVCPRGQNHAELMAKYQGSAEKIYCGGCRKLLVAPEPKDEAAA